VRPHARSLLNTSSQILSDECCYWRAPTNRSHANNRGVRGSKLFENIVFAQIRDAYQEQIEAHAQSRDQEFDDSDDGPLNWLGPGLGVNGFNAYRVGEPYNTPLQFAYKAADCRIWYTPEMIEDDGVL
jgi:hypothetical protein